MKSVGIFLKTKREQKGLTQKEAAAKLGYGSPQFVSNIERGVSMVPTKAVKNFADLYGFNAIDLIEMILDERRARMKNEIGLGGA